MKRNSKSYNSKLSVDRREGGFSLLELLVAMMIFLIVTGAVYGVLRIAQQSRTVVSERVEITKNARLGLNLLGRDTYNTGYGYPLKNTVVLPDNRISTLLGVPIDYDTSRDTIPPIIAGNNVTLNTFNTAPNIRTDQVTFLFKDVTFNPVGPAGKQVAQPLDINAATTTNGIDEIVPLSGSNLFCRINDIYLVTGNTGSTVGLATGLNGTNKVEFSSGDMLGFNQPGPTGPLRGITTPASMMRVIMVTYYVTADGILMRRAYANVPPPAPAQAFVDQPLVYGVENFQIRYVMDDGTVSDNPSAGPDGTPGTADDVQSNLAAIRQVRFTISVRSRALDARGNPFRETLTSTFSTRNLGYEAN